ncbi:MAG: hypothetical protein AAGC81_12380 [Pseudomonadota bacterium]
MTDFSNVGLRNHIQDNFNQSSQTVEDFKKANANQRPDARFRLSGDGDDAKVEIRTGARVTRDRSMGVSIKRFFSGLGTGFLKFIHASKANSVVNRDLRHAGYNLDKAVNNMVEMAANKKEVTDTQIEAHLQNIGKMKHALVVAEIKKGATRDEAMSKVDDRIKTNVKESIQAAKEAGKQNGKNIDDQVFKNVLSFGSHSWGAKHFTDASRNDRTAFAMKQKEYDGVIDEWEGKGNQKSTILDQQSGILAQSLLRAAADELRDETGFYFGKANNPEPQNNANNDGNQNIREMNLEERDDVYQDVKDVLNVGKNIGDAVVRTANANPGTGAYDQGVKNIALAFNAPQLLNMLNKAIDKELPDAQIQVLRDALSERTALDGDGIKPEPYPGMDPQSELELHFDEAVKFNDFENDDAEIDMFKEMENDLNIKLKENMNAENDPEVINGDEVAYPTTDDDGEVIIENNDAEIVTLHIDDGENMDVDDDIIDDNQGENYQEFVIETKGKKAIDDDIGQLIDEMEDYDKDDLNNLSNNHKFDELNRKGSVLPEEEGAITPGGDQFGNELNDIPKGPQTNMYDDDQFAAQMGSVNLDGNQNDGIDDEEALMNEIMYDINMDKDGNIEETGANEDQDLFNDVDGFVQNGGISTNGYALPNDGDIYDDANDGSKETYAVGGQNDDPEGDLVTIDIDEDVLDDKYIDMDVNENQNERRKTFDLDGTDTIQ